MEPTLMANKNNPVSRARGRKPAPVKKPFPVGFAVGCLILALFLGGILTYAARNQGIGDKSSLKYAESQVDDLEKFKGLKAGHKEGPQSYPDVASVPPVGGDHSATPQTCQVYTDAIPNERAVHSLEHGAVWITYQPSLAKGEVDKLKKLVDGDPSRMLSPYPGLKKPISVQAWEHRILADKASDGRIKEFVELFTAGPQTPERGASCQGSTETGPLTAAPAPTPTASATTPAAKPTTPAPTPTK
jgi:hypothetical protein